MAMTVTMPMSVAVAGWAERRRDRDGAVDRYLTAGLHGDHRAWLPAAVDRPDDVRAQAELTQPPDHQAGPLAGQGTGVHRDGPDGRGAGRSRSGGRPRLLR